MNNSRIQAEASKLATSRTKYSLAREVIGLRAESDALKSNLEPLKQASDGLLMNRDVDAADRLTRALNHTPDQYLARRDAEQRAEGIHRAVCVLECEFDPCHPIIERLEQMESEERRQAEGDGA